MKKLIVQCSCIPWTVGIRGAEHKEVVNLGYMKGKTSHAQKIPTVTSKGRT